MLVSFYVVVILGINDSRFISLSEISGKRFVKIFIKFLSYNFCVVYVNFVNNYIFRKSIVSFFFLSWQLLLSLLSMYFLYHFDIILVYLDNRSFLAIFLIFSNNILMFYIFFRFLPSAFLRTFHATVVSFKRAIVNLFLFTKPPICYPQWHHV